jgi:hypothetical protein
MMREEYKMSGQTEYEVVEPEYKQQLFTRLQRAGEAGLEAHFSAVSRDDPREEPELHHFDVKVEGICFTKPVCDVRDEGKGIVFMINFYSHDKARFTIFYP